VNIIGITRCMKQKKSQILSATLHLVVNMDVGAEPNVAEPELLVRAPVLESMENSEIVLDVSPHTNRNFPPESTVMNTGPPEALNGELVIWVGTPVLGSSEYAEMLFDCRLAT